MRWDAEVRKRADKAHAHKRRAKAQRRHLLHIKTEDQLRQMVLGSRCKQVKCGRGRK